MAARYFVGGGTGNWNSTTNWSATDGGTSGASFPIAGDTVFLTAASGANTLTINTNSACDSINCTGFTGTLAGSSQLTVAGAVTFGAGMTLSYSGTLIMNTTASYTCNGIAFTGLLHFQGTSQTFTINGAASITNIQNGGNTPTVNGSDLTISGNITTNAAAGIVNNNILYNGTGTWISSGGQLKGNLTINTLGTLTISGVVHYNTGTLTYTTGTVSTTDSTLTIAASTTLATNGVNWNNVSINGSPTLTLSNDFTVSGAYTITTGATLNGNTLYLGGNINIFTNVFMSGTTNVIYNGTGTWINSAGGVIRNNFTINTAGTLTIGATIAYNTGTLTYTSGTVVTTGSTLTIGASTTLNTNGIVWNNITFSGISTITNNSVLTTTGTLTIGNTIINGSNVNIGGNLTLTTNTNIGNALFVINGTGTWSGDFLLRHSTTINTAGTLTISGSVRFHTATLTYTAGTVITTGSTLVLGTTGGVSSILNTNGINWNNVTFFGSNPTTFTLTSDLTVLGALTVTANAGNVIINGANIYAGGDLNILTPVVTTSGTTNIILNGTGTWTHTSTGALRNNLTINTSGIITISGTVRYDTGTLTYTAGSVVTTGNTLTIGLATTLNTNGINWNNITVSSGITITNNSNLTVDGLITSANGFVINGSDLLINGSYSQTASGNSTGTSTYKFTGTGTWTSVSISSVLRNNVTIDTLGTLTLAAIVSYNTGTLTYTAGTVITTGSTLTIAASTTLNTNGITWNNITFTGTSTITINSLLSVNGTMTLPGANLTFAGTSGWSVNTLVHNLNISTRNHTLVSLLTYTITNNFTIIATNAARITFRSSIGGSQAILTLGTSATQDLKFVNATDIDSSLGQTINSNKGTLNNATNWYRTNGTFMYLLQQ